MRSFALLSVLGWMSVAACSSNGDVDSILSLDGDVAAGETVYNATCGAVSCHGPNGNDGPKPDLTDEVPEKDDEALASIVRFGDGDMPAQTRLTDQDVADVIAYMRDRWE